MERHRSEKQKRNPGKREPKEPISSQSFKKAKTLVEKGNKSKKANCTPIRRKAN